IRRYLDPKSGPPKRPFLYSICTQLVKNPHFYWGFREFGRSQISKGAAGRMHPCGGKVAELFSIQSISAPDGIQQLLRVVPNSILENNLDVLDIRDLFRWISSNHNQVCVLPNFQSA